MDAVKNANTLQKKALQQLTTFTDQEGKKQVAEWGDTDAMSLYEQPS